MPFSATTPEHTEDYWTGHFEKFLKPIIEEVPKVEVRRSKAFREDIIKQIITDLLTSKIIVADLTDSNPNVFWELGVRQSFKHGTITIVEEGFKLPFDVSTKGTIEYNTKNHLKYSKFREHLKSAIQDCLENPAKTDSYVLETISGRGTLFEIIRREETTRRLSALLSEIRRNKSVIEDVTATAKKNKEKPSERSVPTTRLLKAAIELLVTNQYVEAETEFFETAETLLGDILAINDQLSIWEAKPNSTENWILGDPPMDTTGENLDSFAATVSRKLEELRKRF